MERPFGQGAGCRLDQRQNDRPSRAGRIAADAKECAGVRVSPGADDAAGLPAGGVLYVFEPRAPRSVADLELAPAPVDLSARIVGSLDLKADRRRASQPKSNGPSQETPHRPRRS